MSYQCTPTSCPDLFLQFHFSRARGSLWQLLSPRLSLTGWVYQVHTTEWGIYKNGYKTCPSFKLLYKTLICNTVFCVCTHLVHFCHQVWHSLFWCIKEMQSTACTATLLNKNIVLTVTDCTSNTQTIVYINVIRVSFEKQQALRCLHSLLF